jgi:hypothetical protein
VFALGSVLTFAATGYGPFGTGSAEAIVYRVVHHDPDLTRLPAHLTGLISACLAKNPEKRPSLTEILDRLAVPSETAGTWLPPAVTAMISECDRELSYRAHAPRRRRHRGHPGGFLAALSGRERAPNSHAGSERELPPPRGTGDAS